MVRLHRWLLVVLGAVLGAGLRWVVGEAIDDGTVALFVVNTAGCAVLGIILGAGVDRSIDSGLLIGVGFCGALTTYSSLMVDLAVRLDDGAVGGAAAVLLVQLVAGLAALVISINAVRRFGT